MDRGYFQARLDIMRLVGKDTLGKQKKKLPKTYSHDIYSTRRQNLLHMVRHSGEIRILKKKNEQRARETIYTCNRSYNSLWRQQNEFHLIKINL